MTTLCLVLICFFCAINIVYTGYAFFRDEAMYKLHLLGRDEYIKKQTIKQLNKEVFRVLEKNRETVQLQILLEKTRLEQKIEKLRKNES